MKGKEGQLRSGDKERGLTIVGVRAKHYSGVVVVVCFWLSLYAALVPARAQQQQQQPEVVDKMVAIINNRELITYSDLLWQLALQPNVPLDNPRSEDLNRALQLVIDQRLIAQEAEKLPTITPKAEEIQAEITDLIRRFSSREDFYARLSRVGLGQDSEQLREIVRQRVAINNYLEFRFRSFTVVTQQEVSNYYRDVYVPRRRRQSPGSIVPKLEEVTKELERELIESKVESDTDAFLEDARTGAEIVIISPV